MSTLAFLPWIVPFGVVSWQVVGWNACDCVMRVCLIHKHLSRNWTVSSGHSENKMQKNIYGMKDLTSLLHMQVANN